MKKSLATLPINITPINHAATAKMPMRILRIMDGYYKIRLIRWRRARLAIIESVNISPHGIFRERIREIRPIARCEFAESLKFGV